jgi:hypothetical protein
MFAREATLFMHPTSAAGNIFIRKPTKPKKNIQNYLFFVIYDI